MEDSTSKFNINFTREVFVFGEEPHLSTVRKLLKSYYFLNPRVGADLGGYREDIHFVLALADFSSPGAMQRAAQAFAHVESPTAHKIVYVTAPNGLSREQLLFAQEIGARFVCSGPGRNDELKDYLKRVCVEFHQVGSLAPVEEEIEVAAKARNRGALQKIAERLKALPESEDGLRLMVVVYQHLSEIKRTEAYLKRLLAVNPQNLWAANSLGKLFLRNGRAAEGIEVLSKLSHFHELNSERLLMLGNACVVAGKTQVAAVNFDKGDKLTGGTDERFKEGMAKVKLAEKDLPGALSLLGAKSFSQELISFLNMRAILAIRGKKFEEGVEYYDYALKGSGPDPEMRAKLFFNKGLAHVRNQSLEKAVECFKESCTLGGKKFSRAKVPLDTVQAVIKRGGTMKATEAEAMLHESSEWETLF